MKIKSGFRLRTIANENVIMGEGIENIDFSKIISMNESAAFIWRKIEDSREFTVDDMARWLCAEYEVDEETARSDAQELASQWIKADIIDAD